MNLTHIIHSFYFGNRPSPYRLKALQRLHPGGLSQDWADKLAGQAFVSQSEAATHEHYMQARSVPWGGEKRRKGKQVALLGCRRTGPS